MTTTRLPIDTFVRYFSSALDQAHHAYNWPVGPFGKKQAADIIPEFVWHEPSGGSAENISLKHYLTNKWKSASDADRRLIAHWIVVGWGGVRTNREATLDTHLLMALDEPTQKPLAGVASYSKILSVADCTKYAIYDARVAACLNAVQLCMETEKPLFFNYIPSRNNEFASYSQADNFIRIFSKKRLVGSKREAKLKSERVWQEVHPAKTYSTYLTLLHDLKPHFPGKEIYHFEMALFSAAPTLCAQLTRQYQIPPAD